MMISTKGRYALRFLIDIATHQQEGHVPLKEAAERQGLSEKYLEILVKDLVKAGYLSAQRGKRGGYRLAADPEEISVYDVLETMEGTLATVNCLEKNAKRCPREEECRTLTLWKGLDQTVREYFEQYSLASLLEQPVDQKK